MNTHPPLAFVSLRSTGPDPRVDDLTDIAIARVTTQHPFVFYARIRPTAPRAAPFGGIELPLDAALDIARQLLAGTVLVAFDATAMRRLLDATCDFLGVARIDLDPRSLDVRSLVWPYARCARTLADVRGSLGLDDTADIALGDVRSMLAVYREIVEVAS